MKKVRTLAFILAALMLALCFVSCADNGTGSSATTPAVVDPVSSAPAGTSAPETEDANYVCDLPDVKFTGSTVNMMVDAYRYSADEFFSDGYDGGMVSSAVYSRNLWIEDKLGIKLNIMRATSTSDKEVAEAVKKSVGSALREIDIATIPGYRSTTYLKGNFRNLTDVPNLNLDKYYWTQGFNEGMRLGNVQYLASGAYSLSMIRGMYVTLYNKDLLADRKLADPYQMVKDNNWTISSQVELIKDCYSDLDGSTTRDATDFYGFVGGAYTTCDPYWVCFNHPFLTVDHATDQYTLHVDNDRFIGIVTAAHDLLFNTDGAFCLSTSSTVPDGSLTTEACAAKFSNGETIMTTIEISLIEQNVVPSGFSGNYGIVPVPKFNEEQEQYYSHTSDRLTCMVICADVPDDELALMGAVMELFASKSYQTVFPSYYENALSVRYLQNVESKYMLDLIYEQLRIEPAFLYASRFGMLSDFRKMIASGEATAAGLKSYNSTWNNAVKVLNKDFANFGSK